jgi:hypothetical protein
MAGRGYQPTEPGDSIAARLGFALCKIRHGQIKGAVLWEASVGRTLAQRRCGRAASCPPQARGLNFSRARGPRNR